MKRLIITSLLLITCCLSASAQEKKPKQPARVEAAPDIQNAFVLSQAKITAAEANLRAARAEQEALILRSMLILKLSADYIPTVDGGKLFFELAKSPPTK